MAMRERTAFPASLVRRLPKLRLFAMTGMRGSSIDMNTMRAQGVTITGTGLTGAIAVGFGSQDATNIATASDTQIIAVTARKCG